MENAVRSVNPDLQPSVASCAHEALSSQGWAVLPTSLSTKKDLARQWQWHLRTAVANDPLLPPSFVADWDSGYRHPVLQADDAPFLCMPTVAFGDAVNAIRQVAATYVEPILQRLWPNLFAQEVGLPPYDSRWKSFGYIHKEPLPERFLGDASIFGWWNLSGKPLVLTSERTKRPNIDIIVESGAIFLCLIDPKDPTTRPTTLLGSCGSRPCMELCPAFAWRLRRTRRGLARRRPQRLRLWPSSRRPKPDSETHWLDVFDEVLSDAPVIDPETGSVCPFFEEAEGRVVRHPSMESWVDLRV